MHATQLAQVQHKRWCPHGTSSIQGLQGAISTPRSCCCPSMACLWSDCTAHCHRLCMPRLCQDHPLCLHSSTSIIRSGPTQRRRTDAAAWRQAAGQKGPRGHEDHATTAVNSGISARTARWVSGRGPWSYRRLRTLLWRQIRSLVAKQLYSPVTLYNKHTVVLLDTGCDTFIISARLLPRDVQVLLTAHSAVTVSSLWLGGTGLTGGYVHPTIWAGHHQGIRAMLEQMRKTQVRNKGGPDRSQKIATFMKMEFSITVGQAPYGAESAWRLICMMPNHQWAYYSELLHVASYHRVLTLNRRRIPSQ